VPVDDDDPTREVHQAVDEITRLGLAGAVAATEAGARRRYEQERQAETQARQAEREAQAAIVERRAKLLGLDAPVGSRPTDPTFEPTAVPVVYDHPGAVRGVTSEQLAAVSLGNLDPAIAAGRD
jgi:hypothetical protein